MFGEWTLDGLTIGTLLNACFSCWLLAELSSD